MATDTLMLSIQKILGMKNPVLVEQSPDKENIVLAVKNHVTLPPLAKGLARETRWTYLLPDKFEIIFLHERVFLRSTMSTNVA